MKNIYKISNLQNELNAKRCTLKAKAGFTLVETLVYIAIIGTALSSAILFSLNVLEGQQKARVFQEVQQNARFALERISQEIRTAADLNPNASTFNIATGTLSLASDESAKNPTTFNVIDEKIFIKQGSGATTSITSDDVRVTTLRFENLSVSARTDNIRVTVSIQHENPDNVTSFNASTTMTTTVSIRDQSDLP